MYGTTLSRLYGLKPPSLVKSCDNAVLSTCDNAVRSTCNNAVLSTCACDNLMKITQQMRYYVFLFQTSETMILILSIITFVLTLVATGASPCMFVPNDSLQCLEFLTSENMKLGCINSLQPLECTVLTHDMDGVTLIGVKISKKQIDVSFFLR